MRRMLSFIVLISLIFTAAAKTNPHPVPEQVMEDVYHKVKTPHKYGLVLAPDDNFHKMDCPTVYRKGKKWYMTYLVYDGQGGRDGRGYETWLAESDDLLNWKTLGRILSFQENTWDSNQRGGYMALQDMDWGGSYKIGKYKGKNWITYIGGNSPGYELGTLQIGLAYTKGDIGTAHEWQTFSEPLMSPKDPDAQWFESITQYKSLVYRDKKKTLGAPFIMFYNAAGYHPETKVKAERIGIALSKDMLHWERYPGNPVFGNEEGMITGDAHIQKMGDLYVMFYFGAFWKNRPYKAFNTFSCSYDLINWTDWQGPDLIVPSKDYDNLFAHKSFLVEFEGIVYHFYCAVNKDDQRGIAVATSKPMGRSKLAFPEPEKAKNKTQIDLNTEWETAYSESNTVFEGFENSAYPSGGWKKVNLPHNWDDYYGYHNILHGNLHGHAWYRKQVFIEDPGPNKRFFLRFEGIGTYAHIYLNGQYFGRHPSGRTVLTLDVTSALKPNQENLIALRACNRAYDVDMPWVCGGCSAEPEFSEGSEPLGIFRPVSLEITEEVRVEPFGVHVWNDETTNSERAVVHVNTELKNYSSVEQSFELVTRCNNSLGGRLFQQIQTINLAAGETRIVYINDTIKNPSLWSLENPEMYQIQTTLRRRSATPDKDLQDETNYAFNHVTTTPFGLRTISFPLTRKDDDPRFYLNNKAVFINGITEYENIPGTSYAFSDEQIRARVKQIKNAGFNAFRDAHDPHHLLYHQLWDQNGILFWPGFSSHIWYDTPPFRENFKKLLAQWVKERRNSPSVIMWNLQNESILPLQFAQECTDIIRSLDPTAGKQRPITISNGAFDKEVNNHKQMGVDWNVAKNWSGTYRRSLENYAQELSSEDELLNAEYGSWRKLDEHTEGSFQEFGTYSEERMASLLESKVRMAESVRDKVCGHFLWLFASHENPGRLSMFKTTRSADWVGPINYKGIVTIWEEPTDAYYMYKSNYVSVHKDPMVYIASHNWNERWTKPGIKNDITVYSNCDEVELFNDISSYSLGRKKRAGGKGTHFSWNEVDIRYNVLRAVGYQNNRPVAEDYVVLDYLPQAPGFEKLYTYDAKKPILQAEKDWFYLYRVNCGGESYTDLHGQKWSADIYLGDHKDTWGSKSWSDDFSCVHPYAMSQRRTKDPIKGTMDWPLFGNFRFGRHKLQYEFPVSDGYYRLELYFVEPWHGTGSSQADCEGLRIFDVAVNDSVIADDLDIWAEVGHDAAYKIVSDVEVKGGLLQISFPEVKAGQAVISAIAIASKDKNLKPASAAPGLITNLQGDKNVRLSHRSWLDLGDFFTELPFDTYLGEWIDYTAEKGNFNLSFELNDTAEIYAGITDLFSGQFVAQGFTKVPNEIFKKAEGTILYVYKKLALPSEQIRINKTSDDADFVIVACPILNAHLHDVNYRPLLRYEAESAMVDGTFEEIQLGKMEGLRFFGKKSVLINWIVELRDLLEYEYQNRIVRICYQNLSGNDKQTMLSVADLQGNVLFEHEITLSKTTGKWAYSKTTLPLVVKGKVIISLSSSDLTEIAVDALEVL
ncbi:MAG: malectin domain-containing carbohydrate-binding protein [Bacteroidales bacterium]|nr:malectin domain-containing carbohydrate-binding protein [Bacteroidales bacterium]